MTVIARIRQKIRRGEFVHSTHLLIDKLPELDWTSDDVENGIKTGEIYRTLTKDYRGTRYVILGEDLKGYDISLLSGLKIARRKNKDDLPAKHAKTAKKSKMVFP